MRTKFLKTGKVAVRLDKKVLQKNIFVDGQRVVKSLIAPIVEAKIKKEQQQMVEEFEDHPITQEIWEGNNAENTTQTLGGYGNLFSFIGFDEGSDPISPISLILRKKINYVIKRTNDYGGFSVLIDVPEKSEVEGAAKIGWLGGRSWLDGIEKGLAGLNRYLYDEDYGYPDSRSETGIQSKKPIRSSVTYKRTKYMSEILSNFRKRLTRLI